MSKVEALFKGNTSYGYQVGLRTSLSTIMQAEKQILIISMAATALQIQEQILTAGSK